MINGDTRMMAGRFLNTSDDDNVTSLLGLSTSSVAETVPLYTCAVYKFVMSGIITLIISIIGLVGKFITCMLSMINAAVTR